MTELIYLRDALARTTAATVTAVEDSAVILDRTVLYATGGGQPHDTGILSWDERTAAATDVHKRGNDVLHTLEGDIPTVGSEVTVTVDWDRRHQLMRTHTALHILCGVIWNEWGVQVTGGNMEPLKARMDFEFNPLPEGFRDRITELVNAEILADRPIVVGFLPRDEAMLDEDLIRTKVNLIPELVTEIRTIEIVGLDKQADGGTHLSSTAEVGRFEVTKMENKGKGNKRVRMVLHDQAATQ
ncbi:MAG: alanyl-tRNA editing protein [Acidimicrobiales bacterium]